MNKKKKQSARVPGGRSREVRSHRVPWKKSDIENLIDEARLALIALLDFVKWADANGESRAFTGYCYENLRQALKPFE